MKTTPAAGPGTFDRVAAAIGHFDHPLYDDEHHRDVWNEASAVGYQAVTWLTLTFLAVAPWVGGPASTPYVLVVAGLMGVAGLVVMSYVQRRGVGAWRVPGTGTARWVLAGLLGIAMVVGLLRNAGIGPELPAVVGAVVGGVVGAGAVLVLTWLVLRAARRHAPRGED